jgi:lysophospholipase L1-like esterase
VAFGVVCATAAYITWFVLELRRTDELLPLWRYETHTVLFAMCAAALTVLAFQGRTRLRRLSGPILCVASAFLVLAVTDALIIGFRFDTSGPNWNLDFTHFRWAETFVQTNEEGFWERSLASYRTSRTDDRYVIAAVGDSFTFGQGVLGARYRFTDRLQESLQARAGRRIEVLNFGLAGGDTKTETEWVRGPVASTHPDMVIVFYLSNDIAPATVFTASGLTDVPRRWLIASPTFNYLYWFLVGPFAYREAGNAYFKNLLLAYSDDQQMDAHLRDIGELVASIRAIGARAGFVILPFPHMWSAVDRNVQQDIYRRILTTADRAGAAVLNLASLEDEIPAPEFQVNQIDGHPNEGAHARIAGEVYEWLTGRPELLTVTR